LPAGHNEALADGRLADPKAGLGSAHHRIVAAHADTTHDLVPYPSLHFLLSPEQLIAAQLGFLALAAKRRPIHRHLLPMDDHRPGRCSPVRHSRLRQPLDLVVHDQHQQVAFGLEQHLRNTMP